MRFNSSEILSAISQKPIGSGTEATTYDAGSYVVRVPHTVKIDKAFRDRLSSVHIGMCVPTMYTVAAILASHCII